MSPEERDSPPKVDLLYMPKTMDQIIDYLNTFPGVSGVSLGYVVKKLLIPIDSADNLSSNYAMKDLEMIARCPILVPGSGGLSDLGARSSI